jgi:hypothetical protein
MNPTAPKLKWTLERNQKVLKLKWTLVRNQKAVAVKEGMLHHHRLDRENVFGLTQI